MCIAVNIVNPSYDERTYILGQRASLKESPLVYWIPNSMRSINDRVLKVSLAKVNDVNLNDIFLRYFKILRVIVSEEIACSRQTDSLTYEWFYNATILVWMFRKHLCLEPEIKNKYILISIWILNLIKYSIWAWGLLNLLNSNVWEYSWFST